jgi:hypothetical protein
MFCFDACVIVPCRLSAAIIDAARRSSVLQLLDAAFVKAFVFHLFSNRNSVSNHIIL